VNYYEHHLGDYAKDAAHLSLIEDGAYRRLLDAYYSREQPLPGDVKLCCKLARATTKAERDAVAYVLEEFFDLREDGYHQKRVDQELERFRESQVESSERRENEAERQRRHRARRKELFDILRSVGEVPPYDTKTTELEAMASRVTQRDRNSSVTRDGNAPVTRTSTATQTPDTRHQSPEARQTHTPDSSLRYARDPTPPGVVGSPPVDGVTENPALPAIVALRKRGGVWLRLTPTNPEIIAAIREGVTLPALEALADAYPDKPPVYVIRAARREHAEGAQSIQGATHANRSPSRKRSVVERIEANIVERRKHEVEAGGPAPALPARVG